MIHEYQAQFPDFNESRTNGTSGVDQHDQNNLLVQRVDHIADFDHELQVWEPSRPNPKRVTGIHRDIRTTQIDEGIVLPPPFYDEPAEEVPGEQENASGDRPEEITEDAYDD